MTAVPDRPVPPDFAAAYRQIRSRVDGLLAGLSPDEAEQVVPACPRWTVRQMLAHLVGGCSDMLAGRTEGAPSTEWTDAHVAARHDRSVRQLLDEWAGDVEELVARLAGRGVFGQVVMDALTHEYDLRAALGAPHPEPDPLLGMAVGWLAPRFGRYTEHAGLPALRLVVDGDELLLGSGEPAATLRTTPLDALRTITGRRSPAQVAALDWDGDPAPWLGALTWGPFTPPAQETEP